MNIFEGARRIAKIIGVGIILAIVAAAWSHEPYVERYYEPLSDGSLSRVSSCEGVSQNRVPVEIPHAYVSVVICSSEEGRPVNLPLAERAGLVDETDEKRRDHAFSAASYGALGLAFYWLAVVAIGWVVRGFMSIPAGQDYRVEVIKKV